MTHAIPNGALIVVADGGKAIFFRNTGTEAAVTLQEERRMAPGDESAQGPSGSRPAGQTGKQTAEATFVNTVAHALHAMHGQNAFSALVLVAAPQTLGELRAAIHKTVAAAVVHSMPKDLTNHSARDVAEALAA